MLYDDLEGKQLSKMNMKLSLNLFFNNYFTILTIAY